MKILTTVKRVTDYEAKLKLKSDGSGLDLEGINMISNPFDEIGVEEALRIKDKEGGEVVVVSVGHKASTQNIRSALAMGADRGILVETDAELDSTAISHLLQKIVEKEGPDLIIMGKQAIDGDAHQVAEMLAELMGYGQVTQANTVEISGKTAKVVREADGGLETLEVSLPAVITTDLRLNEPRYASLPGIMKAKRKPLEEIPAGDLGVDLAPLVLVKHLEIPPKKDAGEILPDVATLMSRLRTEAKVL